MIIKRVWAWGCGILLTAAAHAQDLTWTELETIAGSSSQAVTMKMSGRRLPAIPEEIEKLAEIAYAEVTFVTTARGQGVMRSPRATNPWMLRAAEDGLRDCRLKPVEHQKGTDLYNETRCYLIFNPESTSVHLPTRGPRALAVRSAIFPAEMLAKGRKKPSSLEVPVEIFADAKVNEAGEVTDVLPLGLAQPELMSAVVTAVKQWRFAPGRRDGSPISTTVRVPVLFVWPDTFNLSELTKPPRAVKQVRPVYPVSERVNGFRGEVMVDFVVTSTGEVREVSVYQSNNPNFNEPALEAVKEWKFEPGKINDRPVSVRMRVPMIFELFDGGSDRYEIAKKSSSKLPPPLQNDYPPRVKHAALGVYPFEQLQKSLRATVIVSFAVRPDGRVSFTNDKDKVLSEFDLAARAMIEEFEFVPASKDGKPNWGLLKMEIKFEAENDQVPVSVSAHRILRELRKNKPAIFQANQVDEKIEPLVSRTPRYPSSLAAARVKGQAVVEFYIDEEGLVQLPRVVSATDPSFGYAGAQAISQWKFKPPTHGGKPAMVRVRIPLVFSPDPNSPQTEEPASPAPAKDPAAP